MRRRRIEERLAVGGWGLYNRIRLRSALLQACSSFTVPAEVRERASSAVVVGDVRRQVKETCCSNLSTTGPLHEDPRYYAHNVGLNAFE